jgi:predicted RecB family nuclease
VAVKQRNKKLKEREELSNKAVKIKCCYCQIASTCSHRANKEKSEALGIITYCVMTPNKPKSLKKSKK